MNDEEAPMPTNTQILLDHRPTEKVSPANFRIVETPVPTPGPGQVLVRHSFLSLDPYMRGRLNDAKSYAKPQEVGAVMAAGTVGIVEASLNPRFKAGDAVVGNGGWQRYGLSDGKTLRVVDAKSVPIQAYLGALGMPGVTAWYGLNRIIEPEKNETVLVSAATGAVGSVVGQLARLAGARAVGIAGGADKCRYVVETLGFDACVDYKAGNLYQDLKAASPDGVDGCFENDGGEGLDATLARMNAFGRIALCGLIAGYNGEPTPITQPSLILRSRLLVQGFIVTEHLDIWPHALRELGGLVAQKKLHYRETISQGLESAPEAFMGLLTGKNFGKQLVKLI